MAYLKSYDIKILKKSSFYETLSYPNQKNPKFINIVILVKTHLPPVDLMSVLIFIEEKLERKRAKKHSNQSPLCICISPTPIPCVPPKDKVILPSHKPCISIQTEHTYHQGTSTPEGHTHSTYQIHDQDQSTPTPH